MRGSIQTERLSTSISQTSSQVRYFSMGAPLQASTKIVYIIIVMMMDLVAALMHKLEPNTSFTKEAFEVGFTENLNMFFEAICRHPTKVSNLMPDFFAIFSAMLANSKFTFTDYADMYSILVKVFQEVPKNDSRFNEQILEAAVLALSNISPEVDEGWSHPIHQKKDDGIQICEDAQIRICKLVIDLAEKCVLKIGFKQAWMHLKSIVCKYWQPDADWRLKFGILFIASKSLEEVEELDEIGCFIDEALQGLAHPHPKMKFATLELLMQLGEHLKPTFQEKYFEIVVPQLIHLLQNNSSRIVSQTFSCLSSILLDFRQFWKVQAILDSLLSPLLHYLRSLNTFIQQNALGVASRLGSIRNCLGQKVGVLIQACGNILEQSLKIQSIDMVQESFECLANLLCNQDKQLVHTFIPYFLEKILTNQRVISDQTFFECWINLCQEYNCFVNLQTTKIGKLLISKAQKLAKSDIEEIALIGLDALSSTFTAFGNSLKPFSAQIQKFLKKIYQNEQCYQSVRNKALELFPRFLLAIKSNQTDEDKNAFHTHGMDLLKLLIKKGDKCIKPGQDMCLIQGVLNGIICLIEPLEAVLKDKVIQLFSKLGSYKQHIQSKITRLYQQKDIKAQMEEIINKEQIEVNNTEEMDVVEMNDNDSSFQEESEQRSQQQAQQLSNILELIPEAYSQILKISEPSHHQSLINNIVSQIQQFFSKGEQWKSLGLSMSLALVENCNYEEISCYWNELLKLFLSFIPHPTVRLRNLGILGAGIIFGKYPLSLIQSQKIFQWLESIRICLDSPFNENEERCDIKHCRDNSISALGKLLKNCGPSFPEILTSTIYEKWLSQLPLEYDELESSIQHEILLQMISSNPAALLRDANGLIRIIQIIANYLLLHNDDKSNQILLKTKECLSKMSQWDIFHRSSDLIWSNLSQGQRLALLKLMKQP